MEMNLNIYKKTKFKNINTTVGRVIFNEQLPKGYIEKFGFVNETLNKKRIKQILKNVYLEFPDQFFDTVYKLQIIASFYGTVYNKSITFNDIELPEELKKEREKLKKINDITEFIEKVQELSDKYRKYLKDNNKQLYDLIDSGASKGKIEALTIAKGPVRRMDGEPYIVDSSLSEGLTSEQFFKSGDSARQGLADRVLNTADTGYLERKLIYAGASVILDENLKDCGTKQTFDIMYFDEIKEKIIGRWFINDKNQLQQITFENVKMFSNGDRIRLRSPIYCRSRKICKTCYGNLYKKLKSTNIGVLAGQVLGERGSQSIMRTFHTGGAVDIKPIDIYKYIAYNNPNISYQKLQTLFKQDKFNIITKDDIVINIKKDAAEINYEENKILLNVINMNVVTKDREKILFLIDEEGIIVYNKLEEDKDFYYLYFSKGEQFLYIKPNIHIVNFKFMRQIFEQTIESKNEYQLYYRIYEIYKSLGDLDNVHIEVFVSEMCRDPDDETVPYRLSDNIGHKDPLIVSIKEIPYLTSPELGLYFENPQKAIENSLIAEYESESSIQKLTEF